MLGKDDRELIRRVAIILAGEHSHTAIPILEASLIEVAEHYRNAGTGARRFWLASLTALGETCITIAKRERNGMPK
jgi:hypothetical protein